LDRVESRFHEVERGSDEEESRFHEVERRSDEEESRSDEWKPSSDEEESPSREGGAVVQPHWKAIRGELVRGDRHWQVAGPARSASANGLP
jgi:hypothetical protein